MSAKCEACGIEIETVQTLAGLSMMVEPKPPQFKKGDHVTGGFVVFAEDGRVARVLAPEDAADAASRGEPIFRVHEH